MQTNEQVLGQARKSILDTGIKATYRRSVSTAAFKQSRKSGQAFVPRPGRASQAPASVSAMALQHARPPGPVHAMPACAKSTHQPDANPPITQASDTLGCSMADASRDRIFRVASPQQSGNSREATPRMHRPHLTPRTCSSTQQRRPARRGSPVCDSRERHVATPTRLASPYGPGAWRVEDTGHTRGVPQRLRSRGRHPPSARVSLADLKEGLKGVGCEHLVLYLKN